MTKKQEKPTKTCADCIHESACRGWTDGRYISDASASRCQNHETVKESGAYLCGVLDERNRKKTNADRIRVMNDDDIAEFLCQVNGCYQDNCPGAKLCEFQGGKANGLKKWLKQPAEEGSE